MISCPALYELFAPELKREHSQGLAEGHAEGLAEGHAEGRADNVKDLIRKKLAKNKSVETIAAELEEDDLDKIRSLIEVVREEGDGPAA